MNKYFMVKPISAKPFTKLHVNTNNLIEMGYVTPSSLMDLTTSLKVKTTEEEGV